MKKQYNVSMSIKKSKLEKVLRKFEIRLGIEHPPGSAEAARKDFEITMGKYAERVTEHPGLYKFAQLEIRIQMLTYFFEKCKEADASTEKLAQVAELVAAGYKTADLELPFSNPFLEVEGKLEVPFHIGSESRTEYSKKYAEKYNQPAEQKSDYEKAIIEDLKKNAPGLTLKKIKELEEKIKDLETDRMGILATATLYNGLKDNRTNESQKADLLLRLGKRWSGFNKTYEQLIRSLDLGSLTLTLGENSKRVSKSDKLLKLSELPGQFFYRFRDYKGGRNKLILEEEIPPWLKKNKKTGFVPLPLKVIENEDGEIDEKFVPKDEIDLTDTEVDLLIKKLSPAERLVIKKLKRDEELNPAERQVKHRVKPKLERLLKEYIANKKKNTA